LGVCFSLMALSLQAGLIGSESDSIRYYHRSALLTGRHSLDSALIYLNKAYSLAESIGNSRDLALNESVRARVLMLNHRDSEAFLKYLEALHSFQSLDSVDKYNEYSITRNIATITRRNRQFSYSIRFYDDALMLVSEIFQEYPTVAKKRGLATAINDIEYFKALSLKGSGELAQAANLLTELWSVAEENEDSNLLADVFIQIGLINKDLQNFTRAHEFFDRALAVPDISEYRLAQAYHNKGYLFMTEGNGSKAREYFLNSLNKSRALMASNKKASYKKQAFITYLDLGELYYKNGEYKDAIRSWNEGIQYYDEHVNDPSLYSVYDWLLRAYLTIDSELAEGARKQYMKYNNQYLTQKEALELVLNGDLFANQIARFEESQLQQAKLLAAKDRNLKNLFTALVVFILLLPTAIFIYKKRRGKSLFKGFVDIVRE